VSAGRVLVVDDEHGIRVYVGANLRRQGYDVLTAANGHEALDVARQTAPDLLVLDLAMPGLDGYGVLERLRRWSQAPVIVLSAHADQADKVRALDLGADDYLTKPFGVPELLARMRAALRRTAGAAGAEDVVYQRGDVKVDLARRQVWRDGEEVHLTPTEYKLLAALVRDAGRVVTHRQLLREVWGANYLEQTHYLRVYMAQLRHKLERDPTRPRLLGTEAGVGYRLREE
jgi:two-component system, OmpR family, KDP operon response regulator KdpE